MSENRTNMRTDPPSGRDRKTRVRRHIRVAPIIFCILLLTVSAATAAEANLYGGDRTIVSTDNSATWNGTQGAGAHVESAVSLPDPGEIREQHFVRYVEDNRSADHGEGVRQIRASIMRQIADLETRGCDVADLRSALESGSEEAVKEALSRMPEYLNGTR